MATNIVSALGAGSGIDIRQLATDLVAAEQTPRQRAIENRIERQQNRITGYDALLQGMAELRAAFAGLDDRSDFAAGMGSTVSSQPAALAVAGSSGAENGTHSVEVTQLARPQRSLSEGGWATSDEPLNGGEPFDLTVTVGGSVHTVSVTTDTPAGVVAALQAAKLGLSARLIDTGSAAGAQRQRLSITGPTGADGAFSVVGGTALTLLGPPAAGSGLPTPAGVQAAQDARLTVDGLELTRPDNRVDDAIAGVTLDLRATTTGAATVTVQPDNGVIRSRFERVVSAYNDMQDLIERASQKGSDGVALGGALVGDPSVRLLRDALRGMVTRVSDNVPDSLGALWQMGVEVNEKGRMTLDASRLDAVLADRLDDVSRMMTADRAAGEIDMGNGLGLGGLAVQKLDELAGRDGFLKTQTANAQQAITEQQEALKTLEDRMARLQSRYLQQFAAMETILNNAARVRQSLGSSLGGATSGD